MNVDILISLPNTVGDWLMFIGFFVVVIVLAATTIYTVFKLIKNGKMGKLREAVIEAIKAAEATHKSGAQKKEMVLKTIETFCKEIGLNFDERLLNWVADYIEKYIADHNELELIEEEEGK